MRIQTVLAIIILCGLHTPLRGEPPADAPRPIPLTRTTMKQMLEDMKSRTPRIPLPPLSEEEKARLGERGAGYESRLRALYMPPGSDARGGGAFGFGGSKETDPALSLDGTFKTQLFWIVSRSNNCQYCLGHQEAKLLNAGMKEDEIAALDSDWSRYGPGEQAAFAFARKFTFEPHTLQDSDIDNLRKHFKDLQIVEMILSMAGNNAINRWKEGTGSPQSANGGNNLGRKADSPVSPTEKHTYLTPTSDEFKNRISRVAPLSTERPGTEPTCQTVCKRPPLESREDVERLLALARKRSARLPLATEDEAREVLGADWLEGPLPEWVRLMANFSSQKSRIDAQRAAEDKGDLTPLLKARVAWIVARQDRAWYAADRAMAWLKSLGQTEEDVFRLDGDWATFSAEDRALFTLARKLAASPIVLTDADVALALKLTGPREVVQLISYTTICASFDRITEAAGLKAAGRRE